MPFKKGQSGNPKGRIYSEKLVTEAIRIAANEVDPTTGRRKLRLAAQKIVDKAVDGDLQAFALIADRLDGKPHQETDLNIIRHDAPDYSRDELLAIIADARNGGSGTAQENGRDDKPDQIH